MRLHADAPGSVQVAVDRVPNDTSRSCAAATEVNIIRLRGNTNITAAQPAFS
jgi:hypothetical protein